MIAVLRKIMFALLTAALLLAAGTAAADSYATRGDGRTTVVFYVESFGNARLTLKQNPGECQELTYNILNIVDGILGKCEEWGKYHITVTMPSGGRYTEDWDKTYRGGSYELSLGQSGIYTVRVVPFTNSEINASWSMDMFAGWEKQPQWWIASQSNCNVYTKDPTPTDKTGRVNVYCYDENNRLIRDGSVLMTQSGYIDPPQISGYNTSSGRQYVNLNKTTGVCSPSSVTFRYRKDVPSSAVLTVNFYDEYGNWFDQKQYAISYSRDFSPPTVSGYTATSGSRYITFYASSGTCSPSSVDFYYRKNTSSQIPQFPGGACYLSLRDRSVERIQPQCGPGYGYAVFASMSGSTKLYKPRDITYLLAHFSVGDWVYVEFGYTDGVTRNGFFPKSLFSPDGGWYSVPEYSLGTEKHGTVTGEVVPRNGPGTNCASYSSCKLYYGDAVHACMESNGWYLCRFYNDHTNNYGDVYLWIPGSMIRWN